MRRVQRSLRAGLALAWVPLACVSSAQAAEPALAAAVCPQPSPPTPTQKADYERAAAAFADVPRLFPNASALDARQPSSPSAAARAAHLRGDLTAAYTQIEQAPPTASAWTQADQLYTRARLAEACGLKQVALRLYRDILWTAYALPGTVALARQGLARLGQPSTVAALPSEAPTTKDEALKAYRAALSQGRDLAAKKQFEKATLAFVDAISYANKAGAHGGIDASEWEAPALSELGLAAYERRDLDEAQHYTREAIRRELFLREGSAAGSLFNLGLILEAKGDTLGAISAYRASLARRPHAAVQKRLLALAPGSDRPLIVPRPLLGPFPSLASYCQKSAPSACLGDPIPDELTYACQPSRLAATAKGLQAPYKQVALFSTGCLFDPEASRGNHYYRLLIETEKGVFLSSVIAERFANRRCDSEVKVRELALRQVVPGGSAEVVLRLRVTSSCVLGEYESRDSESEFLVVAGIAASGTPSSTDSIPLVVGVTEQAGGPRSKPKHGRLSAQASFLPDGTLRISGDPKSVPAPLSSLLGDHSLVF